MAAPATITERFWAKVSKAEGCWLWLAGQYSNGYGEFFYRGRLHCAHRVAWELTHGVIQEGMSVCHSCDVRQCVRPDHLFLGTQSENLSDMDRKGRRWIGPCKLTDDQVRSLRQLRNGGQDLRSLATEFGISETQVSAIARRRYYKRVA